MSGQEEKVSLEWIETHECRPCACILRRSRLAATPKACARKTTVARLRVAANLKRQKISSAIVGQPGVEAVRALVPKLIAAESLDLVIANAENVCGGSGLTPRQFRQLRTAGIDLITMGDHIYRRSEIISVLQSEDCIGKPANFPREAPGREVVYATTRQGVVVAAFSLLGRTFMRPVDSILAAERVLAEIGDKAKVIVVDMHAGDPDKYLMGHFLGRVSAVLGTHMRADRRRTVARHHWPSRCRLTGRMTASWAGLIACCA